MVRSAWTHPRRGCSKSAAVLHGNRQWRIGFWFMSAAGFCLVCCFRLLWLCSHFRKGDY
jgi:hypothetical protein